MTKTNGKNATRAAILDAAKKLFAEKGFDAATVRDICTEAGANVALVSRYFGSKSELYAEVCSSLFDGLAAPLAHLDAGIATAEDWRNNMREWIGHALRLTSATRSPAKDIAGIFRQEMFNPSPMCKYLRDTFMMPVFNCLKRLIEMGGSRSEVETLALMTRIWSQIAFHVVPDETWRKPFRPAGMPGDKWISREAENIAEDVFRQLEFKGQKRDSQTAPLQSTSTPIIQIDKKTEKGKHNMNIKIQPVRFTENGFMAQPFALGGEGAEGLDPAVKYRSCLQNWVIDTGSEVILVDTGLPAEFPEAAADPDAQIYLGTKIKTYLEALADLGYKPEQVSKILITHKHADHTGELRAFPNAKIICSAAEAESDEIKPYNPTVATFADGAYYEFPASQRIAPGVTYISAPGHTTGNCIVAVETDGLFYLIHGDVTYTDVALYENRLSVVFDDKTAARETLDRVRAFCRARPTVYLGTHTPEALESLEQKRVVDLDNPPAIIPVGEIVFKTPTGKYICSVCGYVYDPAEHDGVAFEDLPADWRCPRCKQPKAKFSRA